MDNNYNNNNQGGYVQDPYNNNGGFEPQGSKGMSIASMVLGICAVVFGCCITAYVGLPCGVAGLILGILARKKDLPGKGMAIAGIVCSIVALAVSVLGIIIVIVVGDSLKEWAESLQNASALFIK